MRKLLTITIDTEVDKSPDWSVSAAGSFQSVVHGIPELLEPLFEGHRAKATYLLSGEVIENDDCVDVLRSLKGVELGTHLHGELVGPGRWEGGIRGRRFDEMQLSYDEPVERMKMTALTDLFMERFGHSPLSFRAGRFGAGPNTARILIELGYKVDSSISPGLDWDYPQGRADHTLSPTQPYLVDENDLRRRGASGLMEVPVTIRTGRLQRALHFPSSSRALRMVNRAVGKAMPAVWFRPSFHSGRRMISAGQDELARNAHKGTVVLNMMFHSMEIVPGASPYAQTEEDCRALLGRIDMALEWARNEGFVFATLSELPKLNGGTEDRT